ncbi:MAG TPA: carbohydrate porin [Rickettsiales bacterium]|nr:carbohydrate porin [Rickettsiales bacterium]
MRIRGTCFSALLFTTALVAAATLSQAAAADDTAPVQSGPTLHAQAAADSAAAGQENSSPYRLHLMYTGEEWHNDGSHKTGNVYMQNVYAAMNVDADRAFGWKGASFQVAGFYNTAKSLDANYVGGYIDQSLIDTGGTEMVRLYQAYYKQEIGTQDGFVLGIYDLQTAFGNTKPMGLFMGGSYAWTSTLDQSEDRVSTYPSTALAARYWHTFDKNWSVQAAIADGIPDSPKYPKVTTINFNRNYGAFMIGEVDYRTTNRTKLMAGYWGYTGKFDDLDTTAADGSVEEKFGNSGGYVGGATRIFDQGEGRGIDAFTTIGWSDSSVNQANRTINLGLTYTGPFAVRPDDRAGIAFSTSGTSNAYKHSQTVQGLGVENYESNFEATYRAQICDWLTVQPDVQYFIDPNMDPTLKNDLVVGIHFEIGHVFGL